MKFVEEITRRSRPRDAEIIQRMVAEEQENGYQSEGLSVGGGA